MRPSGPAAPLLGAALCAGALLLGVVGPAFANVPEAEILVRYRGGAPTAALGAGGRRALAAAPAPGGEVVRVAVPAGTEGEAIAALRAEPNVAWAAPNRPMKRLWAIDPSAEPSRAFQWHLDQIHADAAWAFTRGDPSVRVAVVDSGIDEGHPDRPANLLVGPSFAGAPPGDRDGHGTHIAGTIAAPVNGRGTTGVAPDVTVMALKVDDADGVIRVFDVYRAIIWAVDSDANVVNLSLGMAEDSPPLREAVEYARARNVLVVAAAGNSAQDGNPAIYPAAYPGVLAVGATTADGRRAPYSETGAYVSVVAPGGVPGTDYTAGVLGPLPGGYGQIAGTSVAAPIVSGAAALVWSADRSLTAEGVRARLLATAADLGTPGRDAETGAGLLDAGAATREAAAAVPYRMLFRAQECPTIVAAGGRTAMTLQVTNAGGRTWTRAGPGPVYLAPVHPIDRSSAFYLPGRWPGPRRAAALSVDQVPPGGPAEFVLPLQAPAQTGTYREYFGLVAEGVSWFGDLGIYCDVQVVPSTPWLAADGRVLAPARLAPGGRARATVSVRNVGTATWLRDGPTPLRLGTTNPHDRPGALYDPRGWLVPNRTGGPREAVVGPGEAATFVFDVLAPSSEGVYRETFAPVIDGVAWMNHEVALTVEVAR